MTDTIKIEAKPGVTQERQLADVALDPLASGAVLVATLARGCSVRRTLARHTRH